MKKGTAAALVVLIIGVCLALAGFAAGGMKGFWLDRDGFHLSPTNEGRIVVVDETYKSFLNIDVDADFLDKLTIKEGDSYSIKGRNNENNGGIDVKLDGDTLIVKATERERGWSINLWNNWWFNRGSLKQGDYWIEITYPEGAQLGSVTSKINAGDSRISGLACESLDIKSDFGRVDVSSVICRDIDLNTNAGDIQFTDAEASGKIVINNDLGRIDISSVKCDNIDLIANAGDIQISDVEASDRMVINNDFGRVDADEITADTITLELNSGDLRASNVKAVDINARNDFGKITFNGLEFSGLCEITNNAGDVNLDLLMSEDDVGYELTTDAGSVSIDGRRVVGSVVNRLAGEGASLNVNVDFGAIQVKFAG